MSRPIPSEAGLVDEILAPANLFLPMQEGLERAHFASQNLTSAYRDIAIHQAQFVQRGVFDVLSELQSLSRVHSPEEFIKVSGEFAWAQTDRSLKALGDFYTGLCGCWSDAVKAAPIPALKTPAPQSRAAR